MLLTVIESNYVITQVPHSCYMLIHSMQYIPRAKEKEILCIQISLFFTMQSKQAPYFLHKNYLNEIFLLDNKD